MRSVPAVFVLLGFVTWLSEADAATWTHHWAFDGNLNDSLGTQPLTVNATPTYAPGILGQALQVTHCSTPAFCFSNTAAYTLNVIAPAQDGSFTLSCWFKFIFLSGPDGVICGYGQYGSVGSDLAIYTQSASSTSTIFFDYFNLDTFWPVTVNPLDGNWHNVIASYDGTNHIVYAYLDGKLIGTDNKTLVFHDATPYAIGIGARDTVLVDSITAYLDDVYFGAGVATQAQVNQFWNNGKGGSPAPQPALYVSQAPGVGGTGYVTRFDLTTLQATPIATLNGFAQGLACGPDGMLYVALTGYGSYSPPRQIVRMNLDGTGQAVILDFDTTTANVGGGPDGPSFGPDGSLFFNTISAHGGSLPASGVWKLSPGSTTPTQVILPFTSSSASGAATALLTAGKYAGNLIAADITDNKIVRVAPPFDSPQTAIDFIATGLQEPSGLAVDASGNLYVAQGVYPPTNQIYRYGPDGTFLGALPPSGSNPGREAFDSAGNLYVALANPSGPSVMRIAPDGTTASFGDVTTSPANGVTVCPTTPPTQAPPPIGTLIGPTGTKINPGGSTPDPVGTATGNYYSAHTDLAVPGKGLAFSFTRHYNSLDSYSGPLGAGWTHSYNVFLTANSDGTVTDKEADGHQVTFAPTGSGNYSPMNAGVFDTLNQNGDGSFTLTRKNQTRFNFLPAGKLTTIADRNGNTQTLTYGPSGGLASIIDSSGRTFSFGSDSSGRMVSITDSIGRTWRYAYDTRGNLASCTDAAGGITQYAYDANHRMTSATDPRGVTYLRQTYDAQGRVATQTNARGFVTTLAYDTPTPGTTSFTDSLGNTTKHVYDASLKLTGVIDAAGGTVSYTYDANNNRTSVTNQNGKKTSFAFDSQGNTTGVGDPLGNSTSFTYAAKNNLLSATNANGKTTSFAYDANGNLTGIRDTLGNTTQFTYDASGLLVSKTDAKANMTSFEYDVAANLTKITDPLGHGTSLAYDAVGRLLSTTDPNGHTATASYDGLDRLLKIVDALSHSTQFSYDQVGNLLTLTDADGNPTSYSYDATNNLTKVTDGLGHGSTYAYDGNNNRTSFTNAKGNTTFYVFDALNRLVRISDPLGFATNYAYDGAANVVSTTDANGKTNSFSYDALNRLAGVAYADGNTVTYSYDPDGNRLSMVDSHGTTTYIYDAIDRLTAVTSPGGKTVSYAYDSIGNRQSIQYPDGKAVTYSYDSANRLAGVTDWLARHTSYSYDAANNMTAVAYPNTAGISYAYDQANRLTQVFNAFRGNLDVDDPRPASLFRYTLDAVGNLTRVDRGDDSFTIYTYDRLNELIAVQNRDDAQVQNTPTMRSVTA
jgi:YD repeat-containing protein